MKPTPIQLRLISSNAAIPNTPPDEITYQHTVLCQTCLPYRDPGIATQRWERRQGHVHLLVSAGEALHPMEKRYVELGLPCGPKARIVMMHLNAQAIKKQSPTFEVEDSLTAFVKRIGLSAHGRDIRTVKDQLSRLSAATIRLAVTQEDRAYQINTQIVTAFDLWFPKNEGQRVLWPSTVRLSEEYFQSLTRHAVPLNEDAVSTLSHSAMALDIYAWMAQRLHRVPLGKPQLVSWKSLKDQFGCGYKQMNNFRKIFLAALRQVHTQYRGAKINIDDRGMTLYHSPPPVQGRIVTVPALPEK
jgi:hypothetical protein